MKVFDPGSCDMTNRKMGVVFVSVVGVVDEINSCCNAHEIVSWEVFNVGVD